MSFTPNLCCEETKSRGTYTRVTINDYYYSGLSHGAGYPGSSVEKNLPAKAGDMGLIPGWGRSPGKVSTHTSILAWEIPWTEEPGEL